ncbi:MAG TPA: cobyrinate a,c-diamide synthase [Malonomonas sp.]
MKNPVDIPGLLIAAPSSGSGKTSLTLGLMALLRRRGIVVAPFKVGPDYIDPGHQAAVCGRTANNLDSFFCDQPQVREIYQRGCGGAQIAIVEGVMGLFDGVSGDSEEGSSAQIAKWLGLPVVLVVDAKAQARSFAALVKGFCEFDPDLQIAGVIANRVGSDRHCQMLQDALQSTPGLPPLLGCLPRSEKIVLPERHLGLVTAEDLPGDHAEQLADWVEQSLEPAWLQQLTGRVVAPQVVGSAAAVAKKLRIGVARDRAFCFYYPENLRLLEAAGAELVEFSPLTAERLPENLAGLYLGGGYPELHAEQLAQNSQLREQIKQSASAGLPIYAECGGFMYLCQSIDRHAMCGVFPAQAKMLARRRALGYRQLDFTSDSPLGPAGTQVRGHEFHYSEVTMPASIARCYAMGRRGGEGLGTEGYRFKNVLGSYVHLHFASNPQIAANFVSFCQQHRT